MELKKALQLRTEYLGSVGLIHVDENGYFCLNDLADYFPSKRIDNWMRSEQTVSFIESVEKIFLIPQNRGILAKRGRQGGTYAHELIALEFATWLSPEFKVKVYSDYLHGNQTKKDWNMKRILAADNFRLMTKAIEHAHETPKPYHFSNEALMLNEIVFGVRDGNVRDTATEEQLDRISWLESRNGAYIDLEMGYQARKETLIKLYNKEFIKALEAVK